MPAVVKDSERKDGGNVLGLIGFKLLIRYPGGAFYCAEITLPESEPDKGLALTTREPDDSFREIRDEREF
jgi:hypothetical protein